MATLERLFVCIGAQKAGTTWLDAVLGKDPRFARGPFVKEAHYFDHVHNDSRLLNDWRAAHFLTLAHRNESRLAPLLAAWLRGARTIEEIAAGQEGARALARRLALLLGPVDDAWYAELLRPRAEQPWSLDITPAYALVGAAGFAHMARLAPELKLLFVLRNPAQRAWSGLLQGQKKAAGGVAAFVGARGGDIDRLFRRCTSGRDVAPRNDYLGTLEAIEAAGLLDRTLVAFHDDIGAAPAAFLQRVYAHLGLAMPAPETFGESLHARVYATERTEQPPELERRLREHYAPMVAAIDARYARVPAAWSQYYGLA